MSDETVKREYRSALRDEQASATRHRVLTAARDQFIARGYGASSMAGIAKAAGVSRETVYKAFGSKQVLLKAVYDVAVAGDEDDVPVADRPWMTEMLADPDSHSAIATFARESAALVERLGPVMALVLTGARAGDEDLRALAATSSAERMAGVKSFVEAVTDRAGLRPDVTVTEAIDAVWLLTAPEVWQMLVDERGWSLDAYRRWLARSIEDAIRPT